MQSLKAASFDLYSRYAHVHAFRTTRFQSEPLRILDVGDPFGTIAPLFPDDHTVSLDIYAQAPPVGADHQHVLGSGFELPFPDGSFDLVASHDTYEHLPAARRFEFVQELLRVGRGPVVLVAPFDDPRTARCELMVNAQFVTRVGHSLSALDEHAEMTLPDLDDLVGWLRDHDVPFAAHGDGWLYHWLAFYFLKASLIAEGAIAEVGTLDIAVNEVLQEADHRPPHYRRSVFLRPGPEALALPPQQPAEDATVVAREAAALTTLGLELMHALPLGQNPLSAGSAARAWIDAHLDADGATGALAASLRTAFDAVGRPAIVANRVETDREPASRRVSVILVNLDGADYLRDCLDSLAAQVYPRDLTEMIVVDNGSSDGSLDILAEEYPWVRVLPQGRNTGFAPAVGIGVAAASGECVALINNDMRADPHWLAELVRSFAPEDGYVCVAGQILNWDGSQLDFGDGALNFYGMGEQIGIGTPVEQTKVEDGRELVFACGGSMLVSREVYLETGGFDPKYFAYFEDVDFGWRLWLLGYKVRMAANAKTFHHLHGTSSRFPEHQRMLLYERNALRTIIKNYDEAHLAQVLGPAMLLLVKRAVIRGGLDPTAYEIGGDPSPTEEVSRTTIAHLHAVSDVLDGLDDLMAERRWIQQRRSRGDHEIFPLFGRPLHPVLSDPDYRAVHHSVVSGFQLTAPFRHQRAGRLLVVAPDDLAKRMKTPPVRTVEIARALGSTVATAIAVPESAGVEVEGVELALYETQDQLKRLALEADVVIVHGGTLSRHPQLADVPAVLVADMYDPWLFEDVALSGLLSVDSSEHHVPLGVSLMNELLDSADLFLCASEPQRDYWLGMLAARGRVGEMAYAQDPSLRDLVDVVPFGVPDRPLRRGEPVLKGVHPAVAPDDLVVLWDAGAEDWADPLTVLEAFASVAPHVPEARLCFVGLQPSSGGVASMETAGRVQQRATELGLVDTSVIFLESTSETQRETLLLEADIGVAAALDQAESRFSSRSSVLEYLRAHLPVVCTTSDALADEVRKQNAGFAVPAGDVLRLGDALVRLLDNPVLRAECSSAAQQLAASLSWGEAVEPLLRVLRAPWHWQVARDHRPGSRNITEDAQTMLRRDNLQIGALSERVGRTTAELADRNAELTRLRAHVGNLEALVAHQDRRLAIVRNSPLMPVIRRAKRLFGKRGSR